VSSVGAPLSAAVVFVQLSFLSLFLRVILGVVSWILYGYVAIDVGFSYLHTTWRMFVRFLGILTRFVYMNRSNVVTWFAYRTSSSRPEASTVLSGESEYQQPRSASFTSRLPSRQTLGCALVVSLLLKSQLPGNSLALRHTACTFPW